MMPHQSHTGRFSTDRVFNPLETSEWAQSSQVRVLKHVENKHHPKPSLAKSIGAPFYHVDERHTLDGWDRTPETKPTLKHSRLISRPSWH